MEYRIDDQGVAHGLRQHSIGPTFPAVIVGHLTEDLKGAVYYVQYRGFRTDDMPNNVAQKLATRLAELHRQRGEDQALRVFKNSLYYQGTV